MLFWGGSFVWAKEAMIFYEPITIIFFRLLLSSLILFLILALTGKIQPPKHKDLPAFLILAFFEPFLYFLGETNSLLYMDASTCAVLISVIPLCTPFVAYFFLKEKIRLINLMGILISIGGIIVLMFDSQLKLQVPLKGILLVFLAIIAANGYSVMIKKIDVSYSVFNVTMWQNIFGTVFFLPLLLIFSRYNMTEVGFVWSGFGVILKLGIFCSSLAFIFFMFALRHLPISQTSVFTNSIPIFTIIISYLTFQENIDTKKIIGMLIIITGVIVSQMRYNTR
jgi:drug/metabolite transporter (DMT)-like permease